MRQIRTPPVPIPSTTATTAAASRRCTDGRLAAGWALVVGPAAFITAWAVAGAATADYDPVVDAISRNAALGAPHRPLMNVGFVAYGVLVPIGAVALRRGLPGPAWAAAGVSGVATLAVAALPLDSSPATDSAHGVAAALGYIGIGLTPLLAARPLRAAGRRRLARLSLVASVVIGAALVASRVDSIGGLAQRIGLTTGDVWLATAGVALALGHRPGTRRPPG